MLAEQVEIVIGVDTHKHTHTAAVLVAATGAVLAQATVTTDPAGYDALIELGDRHGQLRAWAMEGSGGYGAGLAAHLGERDELVVELDRRDPGTRAYAERRRAEGKSDREIRRCLGRYVTRQLYRQLETVPHATLDAS